MKYFPTLCVDDFFNDPDAVRDFALHQDYTETSNTYPGSRTIDLSILNPALFDQFCRKLTTLINSDSEFIDFKISVKFQKIGRVSSNPALNVGWIHRDDENILAGIVYLNPKPNIKSGTSLYVLKDGEPEFVQEYNEIKKSFYGNTLLNEQHAVQALEKHNSRFIETARFNNVYNRLVCYDASVFHKANSYNNDERLTLVFFVSEYSAHSIPLLRSKNIG